MAAPQIHRLAAFTADPAGGNPAGVVITEAPLSDDTMQRIAADVGYSETAFLSRPSDGRRRWQTRYFSPMAEVPFCGHATIASAVELGGQVGPGSFTFDTPAGPVTVKVEQRDGRPTATLTSVDPKVAAADFHLVTAVLDACGMQVDQLDDRFPPAVAFAGAHHLVLVVRERHDLADLAYDFDVVLETMQEHELTTIAYLWPESDARWHARNLFPVGGMVEDPATGAAAAAFGAYLRAQGIIAPPATFQIVQGIDMGRPSYLDVTVPAPAGGIEVTGTAVDIQQDAAPVVAVPNDS